MPQARAWLLPDTVLPPACTAGRGAGSLPRPQGRDAAPGGLCRRCATGCTEAIIKRAQTPYTVTEQNFTIERLQPRGGNRHAVFFTHPREAITYHYERNPADPRIQHALTLEVDAFGNVLKEVAIGYGRRQPDASLPLRADRDKQTQTLITYTENRGHQGSRRLRIDLRRLPYPTALRDPHLRVDWISSRSNERRSTFSF